MPSKNAPENATVVLKKSLQLLQGCHRLLGHEHVAAAIEHLEAAVGQKFGQLLPRPWWCHLVLGPDQQQDRAGNLCRQNFTALPGVAGGQVGVKHPWTSTLQQAVALAG